MRSSLVLPQTPWSSFPDVMSYFFFLLLQNLFFFFSVYSKSLPHIRCSSTNSLPPPSPLYLLHAVVIKLPLVALESHSIFNKSVPKWLISCDSKYILQSKLFLKVLHKFSQWACLSLTSRVKFFCQLCFSTHSSFSYRQPGSLPQFGGRAIDMLNMKYFTFPCEHILKRRQLLFLVCKYFIIPVCVTT